MEIEVLEEKNIPLEGMDTTAHPCPIRVPITPQVAAEKLTSWTGFELQVESKFFYTYWN